jgi:response regulator RpfG family c-di-GMP phosphodiesterase
MININKYILEKLHLDKDTKIAYPVIDAVKDFLKKKKYFGDYTLDDYIIKSENNEEVSLVCPEFSTDKEKQDDSLRNINIMMRQYLDKHHYVTIKGSISFKDRTITWKIINDNK